jgi:hypothetical protein
LFSERFLKELEDEEKIKMELSTSKTRFSLSIAHPNGPLITETFEGLLDEKDLN